MRGMCARVSIRACALRGLVINVVRATWWRVSHRFSHEMRFVQWRSGRAVLMAGVGQVVGGAPVVMPTLGSAKMRPHVMPNDDRLFTWVANQIVAHIGGATLGTCGLQLAASILGPDVGAHGPGSGGHVLMLCDGSEYYGRELQPAQCLPVVHDAIAAAKSAVCVSALGLGGHAKLGWLASLASGTGGTLSVAHDENALGDALAELVRTFTLRPRLVSVAGGQVSNVTLGAIVHVKHPGDVFPDFVDVEVSGLRGEEPACVAAPVRDATPVETAYLKAASIARKFTRAKGNLEKVHGLIELTDAAITEVTAMLSAKDAAGGRAHVLQVRKERDYRLACQWRCR